MSQVAPQTKSWTKPEFKRLGQIKDVANSQGTGTQGGGAKT